MKKNRKNPGQKSADFQNKAFKPLKEYKAVSKPCGVVTKKSARPEPREKDDGKELFLRAVQGVKAINETLDGPNPISGKAPVPAEHRQESEEKTLFLQAMQKIGTTFQPSLKEHADEPAAERPSSSRMKQLKRGTIRITGQVDLHGHIRDEALAKLSGFITGAFNRGQTAVLVITGKGINSPEGPVLRGAVSEWLRDSAKGMVAEFAKAPGNLGGSGAFVVFLKNR